MEQLSAPASLQNIGKLIPSLESIERFFATRNYPSNEAEVFFYYYASMDWRTEDGVQIKNWVPLAKEWISNLRE